MPFIQFPNVPAVPGVPNIPRDPLGAISVISGIVGNIGAKFAGLGAGLPAAYGIYDSNGNQVIVPDTIQAFSFQNDFSLANYPIEQGAFATYNKTQNPYQSRVLVVKGGNDAERGEFLAEVQALLSSLDLFNIVTPETAFVNVNLVALNYSRINRDGANLLAIDLMFNEVRIAPSAQFSEADATTTPISADQTNSINAASIRSNGQIQPTSPTGYSAGVYNLTGVQ